MEQKFILRKLFFLLIAFTFLFCSKKETENEVQKFIDDTKISDETALYGISRIVFKDSLKSFKSERNLNGKQDVTIEYGGNRAFTFYSEGNYAEKVQMEVVRYILIFYQSGYKRNLDSLRISLVKPYFVKEPEAKSELTEEFEVFRVSILFSEIEKIENWKNSKLLNDKKSASNSNVVEFFNQVRLRWKIELNELNRIKVK